MYKIANTFAAAIAVTLFVVLIATFGVAMMDDGKIIENAAPIGTWNSETLGGQQATWVQQSLLAEMR